MNAIKVYALILAITSIVTTLQGDDASTYVVGAWILLAMDKLNK